jgi:hypothetical protein
VISFLFSLASSHVPGLDALNWFQRILGLSSEEIKLWTDALTQPPSPSVKRQDVLARGAFEFENSSRYCFCKPPADVFFVCLFGPIEVIFKKSFFFFLFRLALFFLPFFIY